MSQEKQLSKQIYKYLPFHNNTIPKYINIKSEYDLNKEEINIIEKLTNSHIEENIGSGGFSIVKKVFNPSQHKYFALKVINLDNKKFKKKKEKKNKELINTEIHIQKQLHSTHTVKLEQFYEYKQYFLLLMEYCDNIDLKHFMKNFHDNNPHLQLSELLCGFFMIQILNALYFLWMQNILHRDLKPENIMLTNDYCVKIGDFSLSKRVDKKSKFITSRSGTIPYLAPECVKRKKSIAGINSYKADMFSIGVIMYFFLFHSHPFQFKHSINIEKYIEHFKKVVPSYQGNTITRCCKDFLSRCLSITIKQRLSIEEALNHNWILKIKDKVNEIKEKYAHDNMKMIAVLNNTKLEDSFFDGDRNKNINTTTASDNELDVNECSQNTFNIGNSCANDGNNKQLSMKRKR